MATFNDRFNPPAPFTPDPKAGMMVAIGQMMTTSPEKAAMLLAGQGVGPEEFMMLAAQETAKQAPETLAEAVPSEPSAGYELGQWGREMWERFKPQPDPNKSMLDSLDPFGLFHQGADATIPPGIPQGPGPATPPDFASTFGPSPAGNITPQMIQAAAPGAAPVATGDPMNIMPQGLAGGDPLANALSAFRGVQAPAAPEVQRISSPPPAQVADIGGNNIAQLLRLMIGTGGNSTPALRLAQALGGR